MRVRHAFLALLAVGIGLSGSAQAQGDGRDGDTRSGRARLRAERMARFHAAGDRDVRRGMRRGGPGAALEALDLTDAQKEQLQVLREQFQAERQARRQSGKRPGEEEIAQIRAAHQAALAEILTPEQWATLQELRANRPRGPEGRWARAGHGRRHRGPGALLRALDLTEAQKEQLQVLREQFQAERQARRQSGERPSEEEIAQIRAAHRAALAEILTPEQLATLEKIRSHRPGRGRWGREVPGPAEAGTMTPDAAAKRADTNSPEVESSNWGSIKKALQP